MVGGLEDWIIHACMVVSLCSLNEDSFLYRIEVISDEAARCLIRTLNAVLGICTLALIALAWLEHCGDYSTNDATFLKTIAWANTIAASCCVTIMTISLFAYLSG